jgi:hypothetical protein
MKPVDKKSKEYFRRLVHGLKIRHKLALAFLPILLMAVILIGTLWYRNALDAVGKTLEDQTSILAQNAGLQVEN